MSANFLLTSGATREAIDQVRFISNLSTGRTGSALSDCFIQNGAKVLMLAGQGSILPNRPCEVIQFLDFKDLNEKLKAILSARSFDAVLHLAAVSDFSVGQILFENGESSAPGVGKIDSSQEIFLKLTKNFKIIDRIKSYCKEPKPLLIGFKLTSSAALEQIQLSVSKLFAASACDYVVHNDLSKITQASHTFSLYGPQGLLNEVGDAEELGLKLLELGLRRSQACY